MITTWQAVLRALVYDAFDKRDGDQDAFRQAVVEIVDTWINWPLICHRQAILQAHLEHEQREAEYVGWLETLADLLDVKSLDSDSRPSGGHRARPNLSDSPLARFASVRVPIRVNLDSQLPLTRGRTE